jgi:RHS repeat-associated protein
MRIINGKVHMRWLSLAVMFLLALCAPKTGVASPWGYPPDSPQGQCLAHYGIKKVFPDQATAEAAVAADCSIKNDECVKRNPPMDHPFYVLYTVSSPWPYCELYGDPLYGCSLSANEFRSACCANADGYQECPDCAAYWFPTDYCNGPSSAPDEQYDFSVEDGEKNLGGSDPIAPGDDNDDNPNSCPASAGFVGNPIKVATGNKYEKTSDISVLTPGIALKFVRHYNKLAATDGPLGYGWTHSFGANLQVVRTTPSARVKIKDADGRAIYFSQLYYANPGEINFYGESGVKDRLKKITATGHYVLRKKKGNLTYLFDSSGTLTQISDPSGNTLTLTYSGGLLTGVSNNFGNSITFQYSGSRISSVTDPKGQSVIYTYSGSDLTGVSYPDGRSLSYAYSNHNLTDKYDSSNHLIGHWDYDTDGRVSNHYRYIDNGVYQEQMGFTYNFSSTGQPVTLTRSTGTTTYKTAVKNSIRVITEIDNCTTCGGITKLFTYTPGLDLASESIVSEGQTYTTQYLYDDSISSWLRTGEAISMKEAAGHTGERTTSYTYTHRTDDPFLLTQSTESKKSVVDTSRNKVITTTYDSYGNVASRTVTGYTYVNGAASPATQTTSYLYNSYGQITQIDGPRTDVSDITTFEYYPNAPSQGNNRGRLASVTNAMGQATLYGEYDANGNVGTITDPKGVVTRLTYDQRNRLLTITNQATNAETQYSYDTHGNLYSITYPEGNTITLTYNLGDRLIEIRDNLDDRIQYGYDDQGNRISEDIVDPQGAIKKSLDYTYDEYNRLHTLVNPDSTSTVLQYDGRGNVTAITDPKTQTTTFGYDALSRKTSMTQPLTSLTGYGYDTQDNPTLVTDPNNNSTHYVYDDFSKKYQTVSPDTGTSNRTHDAAGNLVQTIDANGNTITYTYDALNRLLTTQFSDPSQNITNTYDSTSVTYGAGRLTGRIDASGTYVFFYDARGNMVREDRAIGGIVYSTQYVYNKNGKLTSITYPTGRTITYTMDQTQRIAQVDTTVDGTSKTLASSVSYAPFGGITSLIYGNNLSLTQAYNNQYRVSSIVAGSIVYRTYAYDANGHITSIVDALDADVPPVDFPSTYIYENGSNVLTEITGTASTVFTSDPKGNTITQNSRTHVYDPLNQLTAVWDGSTQIAHYTFNGIGQRIQKNTASGTKIFHYDSSGHIIAETGSTGQMLAEYVYLGDQLLATIRPGEIVYYYHNDHLGTPQVLTDSTGNVAWKGAYALFGKVQILAATVENNFRFPGQYYDSETGLSYNYHRYYRSEIGRYITADPIGLDGGINPFVYVQNDSVNGADLWGLLGPIGAGAVIGGEIGTFGMPGPGTVIGIVVGAAAGTAIIIGGYYYFKPPADAGDPNGSKSPGKPGEAEGFKCPKRGDNWVRNPNGPGSGWEDANGRVWVPTGLGDEAHGGPHWDVQDPRTGGKVTVYPGGRVR